MILRRILSDKWLLLLPFFLLRTIPTQCAENSQKAEQDPIEIAESQSMNSNEFTKLNYQPNPQYQNLIDTAFGEPPRPVYPLPFNYFVYGGIFSMTSASFASGIRLSGYQEMLSMVCAVRDVNVLSRKSGMNTTFFYNVIDDQSRVDYSMLAAAELAGLGVPAVIGPSTTDTAEVVGPYFTGLGIPLISGSTTADFLSDGGIFRTFVRTIPPDRFTADAMIHLCEVYNWTLVATVYALTTFGTGLQISFEVLAAQRGIDIICTTVINPGGSLLVGQTASCISISQTNVVFLFMTSADAANVIETLNNEGSLSSVIFVVPNYFATPQHVERYTQGQYPVSVLKGSIGIAAMPGELTPFFDCLGSFKPYATDLPYFDLYYQITGNCLLSNDTDLPRCPANMSQRAPYPNYNCTCGDDELRNIPDPSVLEEFPVFLINFDLDSCGYPFLEYVQYNCSGLSNATGLPVCAMKNITSEQLSVIIKTSSFEGRTGRVAFIGNNPVSTQYIMTQIGDNGEPRPIGFYTPKFFGIKYNETVWKQGSPPKSRTLILFSVMLYFNLLSWLCLEKSLQQITLTSGTSALAWLAVFFSAFGIIITLSLMIFFWRYRRTEVVRKTSFVFSELILLGILFCLVSQILWSMGSTSVTCILQVIFLAIGFGLIMSNLIAKTYRIYEIFTHPTERRMKTSITDRDLLPFVISILLLEAILVGVYAFAGGSLEPVTIQSKSDFLLIYSECKSPSSFLQLFGQISLLVVNFMLILVCCYYAYRTRNVDSDYNESRYIGSIIFIYFLVCLIILPLYYTSGDSRSSLARQFIFRTVGILACLFATIFWLFLTKVQSIWEVAKRERAERNRYEQELKKRTLVIPPDPCESVFLPLSSAINADLPTEQRRRGSYAWDEELLRPDGGGLPRRDTTSE